jgi:predicted GNAT family acetyltransferase
MLALAELTDPGPFGRRSIELGRFVGFRAEGELVAMAGERLHPPGFSEVSAVCTHPDHRGQGLARELVLAVACEVQARGEVPFLHVDATDDPHPRVVGLYERLGFRVSRRGQLTILQRKSG